MRILPRSRRGTWLLTGAVWVAACAGLWWALPVVPRAILRMPEEANFVGFGPNGDTVLVTRRIWKRDGKEVATRDLNDRLALELEQLLLQTKGTDKVIKRKLVLECLRSPSGELLMQFGEVSHDRSLVGNSAGGRYWLFRDQDESATRFIRLDLSTGAADVRSEVPLPVEQSRALCLSPDGQFCVLYDWSLSNSIVLWDIAKNRILKALPGTQTPVALSTNGRYLATGDSEERSRVNVFDLENDFSRKTFDGPKKYWLDRVSLNQDGTFLAGQFETFDPQAKLIGWNLKTGEIAFNESFERPQAWAGNRVFASTENAVSRDVFVLLDDLHRFPAPLNWRENFLSPDSRNMFTVVESTGVGFFENIAARLGVSWPFPPRDRRTLRVIQLDSMQAVGEIGVPEMEKTPNCFGPVAPVTAIRWSSDGRLLAVEETEPSINWKLWDIPPRKPLTWFAAGAALLALPITWLARWRMRKLRAVAA